MVTDVRRRAHLQSSAPVSAKVGGVDPFLGDGKPLTEDQLVMLRSNNSLPPERLHLPRRCKACSASIHDAVVLELVD